MEKFDELIKSPVPILVDFYAEWCGPCKSMKPVLEEVKKEVGESARIIKIDVDKFEALAAEYHIQTVPTFILFKNGENLWRQSGAIPGKVLKDIIKQHI